MRNKQLTERILGDHRFVGGERVRDTLQVLSPHSELVLGALLKPGHQRVRVLRVHVLHGGHPRAAVGHVTLLDDVAAANMGVVLVWSASFVMNRYPDKKYDEVLIKLKGNSFRYVSSDWMPILLLTYLLNSSMIG